MPKRKSGLLSTRKVFTTGQVAKICKVAPRTVSKWFDSGRLKGYRIPGSQDRRIPRESLIQFLKEHGMPLGELEDEILNKILLVGVDTTLAATLRQRLPEEEGFQFQTANSAFEAGIHAEGFHPDCIIIDTKIGRSEALQIAQNLRRHAEHQTTILVALIGVEEMSEETLKQQGFNEVFRKPFDVNLLAERVRRLVAERKNSL
jgi:excisionase family DNA binding protein